jgi:hypothetical protein
VRERETLTTAGGLPSHGTPRTAMPTTATETEVIYDPLKGRVTYRTGLKTTGILIPAYDSCTEAQRAAILERLVQTIRQEGHALTPEREMDFRRLWYGF